MKQLINIRNDNGVLTVGSLEVAGHFEKQHKNVIQTIQNLAAENSATKNMFIESTYENRGKRYPQYLITRDGFSLLVMGFTGKKALEWKLKYIEAFNKMEQQLKQPRYVQQHIDEPYTYKDKYWQDKQVLTLMDIEQLTGCPRHSVLYYIKHTQGFRSGVDFYFLEGADLREFKRQNGYNKYANSLWLLTESGCRKLSKGFSEVKGKLMCFNKKVNAGVGVELRSLKTIDYVFNNAKRDLEKLQQFIELLEIPMTKKYVDKGQELIRPYYDDFIRSMGVLLDVKVDNDLQVWLQ